MKGPKILVSPPGPEAKKCMERWKVCSTKSPGNTIFSRGEGIYVWDLDGNVYLDFASQTTNVGHKNSTILSAVRKQLEKSGVSRIHGATLPQIELMEKIKEIVTSGLSKGKFYFCNTGSEATEYAMELARAYTNKSILIAYLGGHYGWTIGALSLTADRSEYRRFCLPLIPNIVHVPYPYCYRCPFSQKYPDCNLICLEHIQYILDTVAHPDEVAAIFIEPVQQVGGVVPPPKEYFPRLKKLCEENEILMVDDEVATGFGRTGKMFGIEHWNVDPDMMYMGKAFANGIQMAGIIAREGIMEKEPYFPLARQRGLISCVSALATIEEIQKNNLVKNSAEVGEHMIKRLKEISEEHKLIGDVRGKGLLIGIELVKDRESKKPAMEDSKRVVLEAFKRGLLIGCIGTYKQVIRLTPPLILSIEESDKAIDILDESIKEIE